jgi:methylenetetrahydrofolate dehydrogenase (NADP+)/methenyltetrahydrofolate cyclohydrolase
VQQADIVGGCWASPNVPGEWIKRGAIVLDVGITRTPDGMLCGDVEFASASERAS